MEPVCDPNRNKEEGLKFDEGKLRFDLIPIYPLEELARVYTIGAKKYGDYNWRQGMRWSRIIRAGLGHFYSWIKGEKYDKEDGQHHLASVAWCVFALMQYEKDKNQFDDRYSPKLPTDKCYICGKPAGEEHEPFCSRGKY